MSINISHMYMDGDKASVGLINPSASPHFLPAAWHYTGKERRHIVVDIC